MDLEQIQEAQQEFQKNINEQMSNFIETMMNTASANAPSNPEQTTNFGVVEYNDDSARIEDLTNRVEALESALIGFQLPISFRYRNDLATGIHRLEYILKKTPYSDGTATSIGTTEWPDDEWIAVLGADAEIYTP